MFVENLIEQVARVLPQEVAEELVRKSSCKIPRAFKRRFRCGARCVSTQEPCRARALESGRCKWHGGMSTGPKTAAGKACIAEAQRRRWSAYRRLKAATFPQP